MAPHRDRKECLLAAATRADSELKLRWSTRSALPAAARPSVLSLTYATHICCSSCVLAMSWLIQFHTRCVRIFLSTRVAASSMMPVYCSSSSGDEEDRRDSSTTRQWQVVSSERKRAEREGGGGGEGREEEEEEAAAAAVNVVVRGGSGA